MRTLFLSIITALVLSSCGNKQVNLLDASAFENQIKNDSAEAQIIDVRTPQEFADDHLNNAKNIDWNGDKFTEEAKKLDADKPTFVYCAGGKRSAEAAAKLIELGFKQVYDLDGGFRAWNNANKATEIGATKVSGEMTVEAFNKIIASNKITLVDFNATWCPPCKKLSPILDELSAEKMETLSVLKIDVDQQKTIADHFKIYNLPELRLYQNGKLLWQGLGFHSKEQLLEILKEFE